MFLGAERAGRRRRHRLDLREQHVGRSAKPRGSELDALERRSKLTVVQILAVARRAALFVDRVARDLLRRRERRRRQRLRAAGSPARGASVTVAIATAAVREEMRFMVGILAPTDAREVRAVFQAAAAGVASVCGIRAERTRAAGEVRRARAGRRVDARRRAASFSTQSTMAPRPSKLSVAGPPAQWFMPGTRNSRAHRAVAVRPAVVAR